ncbi:PepSY-associated TM helix domain-containing protein [Thiohalorhabdus sp. Cl-TMA]|uniref:PepSY-associated TM helix domain-containing protein n=1 Tax=Thiohalorhabdus methylotrophus TaxID=3242694 RepID=A0ABV4TYM4_9GAMM
MNGRRLKGWYRVHKWTSLICTVFMLLLFVTGLPLIFHEEIDRALGYRVSAPAVEASGQRAEVDAILADARERRPDEVVQFLVREPEHPDLWFVRLGETVEATEASSFLTYDARTGELLNAYPVGQGVMNVILRLHVDMFAGLWGTLFLGAMGLLLVASLVSGAVLYAPYLGRAGFGRVRRQTRRLRWLDAHNLVGMATLVWVLVVGFTGVVNTLSVPIFSQWQSTQLAEMTAGATGDDTVAERSPAEAVTAARRAQPDKALSFMAFPGNGFTGDGHFMAYMQGTTPLTAQLLTPVMIDADTGEVVATRGLPWYVSALLLSQPLHFGDYGGLPLKILWGLLDLLAIGVLVTGLYLWLRRNGGRSVEAGPRPGNGPESRGRTP